MASDNAEAKKHFTIDQALDFARHACRAAGASEPVAASLAQATVSAEIHGQHAVGFAHLLDYLASFAEGRIDGAAEPLITFPTAAVVQVNARGSIAQLGFDNSFDELVYRALNHGIALFIQRNSYTAGELGYYVRRLADAGLVALAVSNGPPLMAPPEVRQAVYCTNPLAFSAPGAPGSPVVIDQASSATAFVNIRAAAEQGRTLQDGWAIDANGNATTDPAAALDGTLLTFGGARGANIALMVELLAAGLSGANWSLDAPAFNAGRASPGAGLTIIAIAAERLQSDFSSRVQHQVGRLAGFGVHVPGQAKAASSAAAAKEGIWLPEELVARINIAAGLSWPQSSR